MKKHSIYTLILLSFFFTKTLKAQESVDQIGAWYMYFYNKTFKDGQWGVQGDVQYRNWNFGGDLEQLLIRSGITFKPKNTQIKFTLGYGNITSGTIGSSVASSGEHRIYQEALYPVKFGNRIYTNHRFRYEQRLVENQDLRTRYRYNLFINVPLNKKTLEKKTIYLALYNEIFINGQREVGNTTTVELFDRNRAYVAIGYLIKNGLRVQIGLMNQTTNSQGKNQLQVSLHHNF
ncbi:MAG: DUF2490 domain-containing protein [Crocinitomicaceae bacterium]|nr:DUF2490 domain-containing protein [Crocinitomicaceae bacterium]